MRRTLLTALLVLLLALAVCLGGTRAVAGAVGRADTLRQEAERAARLGDTAGALRRVEAMISSWREDGRWLELVTSHDALSDIQSAMNDARQCLENHARAEFLRASATLAADLERLRITEAARVVNLF